MDERFMREALDLAKLSYEKEEIPVGCVIVKDGEIVGKGRNMTVENNNPTCHAEIMAISQACKTLGSQRLCGCEMYITLEPCSMCAGAIVLARIEALYIGALDPKTGACVSLNNITTDERLNHQVHLQTGVLSDECSNLLKSFFRELRKKKEEENQSEKDS